MEDLILDFNLYLCEKFGYRNSCSVMQNANGFCVNISERLILNLERTLFIRHQNGCLTKNCY